MKKPKEKIKKIHSLRHQITAYFIGLLFLSILTITVINGAFLEKYYVTKKIDVLLNLRTTLENTDIDKMMNSSRTKEISVLQTIRIKISHRQWKRYVTMRQP